MKYLFILLFIFISFVNLYFFIKIIFSNSKNESKYNIEIVFTFNLLWFSLIASISLINVLFKLIF